MFRNCFFLTTAILSVVCAGQTRADSVSASVFYSERSIVWPHNTSTGAPLTFSASGTYGSGTASGALGYATLDLDVTGDASGSAQIFAGGNWSQSYTINGTPEQQGTTGTANFTFTLNGSFSATNVGVGLGQSVSYSFSLPALGYTVASGTYGQGIFDGIMPPPTTTIPIAFYYGVPFDVAASLGGVVNPGRSGDGSAGHVHLTLQSTGFSVVEGNYTANSATGAGKGATFASNTEYDGFTLTNTVGHQSKATLVDGTAGANRDVSLSFLSTPATLPLVSDVLDVKGLDGDLVVIQMEYDEAAAIAQFGTETNLLLSWFDPATNSWKNAVDGNTEGSATKVEGAYDPDADFVLGTWGQDAATNVVWAVVNHNSEFAVTSVQSVPEPGSVLLLAMSGLVLGSRRRR